MKRIFEKLDRYFCGKWRLAVLDLSIGRWIVQPKASNIAYLKAQNANRRHILIQPDPTLAPYYLMIDDLPWHLVTRQHQLNRERWKPGRMIVETSRENYQVWVHSFRPLSLEEKRHWLKRLNSDPGTDPNNRWGRCPGFRNRKSKHRDTTGGYPLSKLLWIDWGCQADVPCRLIHSPGKASRSPSTQSPVWRGPKIGTSPAQTTHVVTSRQRILHMPWHSFAGDLAQNMFETASCLKGKHGITTPVKSGYRTIWIGRSNVQGQCWLVPDRQRCGVIPPQPQGGVCHLNNRPDLISLSSNIGILGPSIIEKRLILWALHRSRKMYMRC